MQPERGVWVSGVIHSCLLQHASWRHLPCCAASLLTRRAQNPPCSTCNAHTPACFGCLAGGMGMSLGLITLFCSLGYFECEMPTMALTGEPNCSLIPLVKGSEG